MRCLLVNFAIAIAGVLFVPRGSWSGGLMFGLCFAVGTVLIALLQPVLPRERYPARVLGLVRFGAVFLREFLLANVDLLRTVLFVPKEQLHPGLLTVDVRGLTRFEILVLTHCISLTPGSVSVQVEDDFNTILIHALNARDPDAVRRQIHDTFVRAIQGFARP